MDEDFYYETLPSKAYVPPNRKIREENQPVGFLGYVNGCSRRLATFLLSHTGS